LIPPAVYPQQVSGFGTRQRPPRTTDTPFEATMGSRYALRLGNSF